jgi:hypothetical protein
VDASFPFSGHSLRSLPPPHHTQRGLFKTGPDMSEFFTVVVVSQTSLGPVRPNLDDYLAEGNKFEYLW